MMTYEPLPQKKRVLWVLWDCGGNVAPQLTIGRRLVHRGYQVRVIAPRSLQRRIEHAELDYLAYRFAPEHDSLSPHLDLWKDFETRNPMAMFARLRDHVVYGTARAFFDEVCYALEAEPADVVCSDFLLAGALAAAEKAGVPSVAMMHTLYSLPHPGRPPLGLGCSPAQGTLGKLRDISLGWIIARLFNLGLQSFNQLRREHGLRPLRSLFDQALMARRVLVLTSQAFDFPAPHWPANVCFVGPQFDDLEWLAPWSSPWPSKAHNPLVLVSLSTSFMNQRAQIRRVLEAVTSLPIRVLLTVGPAFSPESFVAPTHVVIRQFVPHLRVLPDTSIVVTHAGHGTVMAALSQGVPLVCLPMGRDQDDVAARVAWRGTGLVCSAHATPIQLRTAIERVLSEARFRQAAGIVRDEMARLNGPLDAIREIAMVSGAQLPIRAPQNIAWRC